MRARGYRVPSTLAKLVRVVKLGGALVIAIPRALARELAIHRRDYVLMRRGPGRSIIAEPQEIAHVHQVDGPRRTPRHDSTP